MNPSGSNGSGGDAFFRSQHPATMGRSQPGTSVAQPQQQQQLNTKDRAWLRLKELIYSDEIADLHSLRAQSWHGIPAELRPVVWKLLLGYLPAVRAKREALLERKRNEYEHLVQRYFNNRTDHEDVYRQIHIDIPRMQPLMNIFQQEIVQKIFERILFIWSIRHPASGYVQGMNDLVTPFFVTYLSEYIPGHLLENVEKLQVSSLPDNTLREVEADSFWSLAKLLDSIQENYTFAQPGIQKLVHFLERLMARLDSDLHDHLSRNSVQYLHFSFRWMNNLLIRELPLRCIIRLWDSYFSEGAWVPTPLPMGKKESNETNDFSASPSTAAVGTGGSSASGLVGDEIALISGSSFEMSTPFGCSFHLYVCAAFLKHFSKQLLKEKDFQGLMIMLQNLPTNNWTEQEIALIVADAYRLKNTYTPNHLK